MINLIKLTRDIQYVYCILQSFVILPEVGKIKPIRSPKLEVDFDSFGPYFIWSVKTIFHFEAFVKKTIVVVNCNNDIS